MSGLAIGDGHVAMIHYRLKDDDGKVIDSSKRGTPLAFLAGAGNVVVGLDNALAGKVVGDKLHVDVSPEDGYGEVKGEGPQAVPKREFGKQAKDLRKGMPLRVKASDGTPVVVWVHEIRGSRVYIDINHPLAGKTLHFDVEVVDIRKATAEEVAHGHVHGPGGHGH
jgi:FKBP-type peptidyl-prolyl cis-trans isomerase SlyD